MTTIATDGRSMAGDGAQFMNEIQRASNAAKVVRLPDGGLVGCSGNSHDCEAFRQWLIGGQVGPRPRAKSLSVLHLQPDGTLLYYNQSGPGVVAEFPAAVGTGNELALGAMLAGASPKRAVEIAAERDPFTAGRILVL